MMVRLTRFLIRPARRRPQDELGQGLVRAVQDDLELDDAVEATYEDGVFTLTAKTADETGQ